MPVAYCMIHFKSSVECYWCRTVVLLAGPDLERLGANIVVSWTNCSQELMFLLMTSESNKVFDVPNVTDFRQRHYFRKGILGTHGNGMVQKNYELRYFCFRNHLMTDDDKARLCLCFKGCVI